MLIINHIFIFVILYFFKINKVMGCILPVIIFNRQNFNSIL